MKRDQEQQRQEMMKLQQQTLEILQTALKKDKVEDRKTKCPKWDKQEPLKRFAERLKLWNKIHGHKGKYLELLESLQSSDRTKEKERIELEVQNSLLDPRD